MRDFEELIEISVENQYKTVKEPNRSYSQKMRDLYDYVKSEENNKNKTKKEILKCVK